MAFDIIIHSLEQSSGISAIPAEGGREGGRPLHSLSSYLITLQSRSESFYYPVLMMTMAAKCDSSTTFPFFAFRKFITPRCTLPRVQLLNFEVAPVLDLRVTPTDEDCTVEMLSCKFVGSEVLERQNDHFSASMRNRITWDPNDTEPFLDVDVKLNLTLEIYTQPFTMLPISAVEGPGNLMMQTLLDRLVPLLVQQLLQDYSKWVQQQSRYLQ
ncbi:hypothetical protein ACSBR2_036600 [Camellia fascicularis]